MRLSILLVLLCGCCTESKPKKYFDVVDSNGKEFKHLELIYDSQHESDLIDQNGKKYMFKGDHSCIESTNCEKSE